MKDSDVIKLIIILPWLAGILIVSSVATDMYKSIQVKNWTPVDGTVNAQYEDAGVRISPSRFLHNKANNLPFSYNYKHYGVSYHSSVVGFGVSNPTRNYRVQEITTVYVNPDNPTESSLEAGVTKVHIVNLLFGLFLLAVSYLLFKRMD